VRYQTGEDECLARSLASSCYSPKGVKGDAMSEKQAKYAAGTTVSTSQSREEIEHTLQRFGASKYIWARDDENGRVTVGFNREQRTYRISFSLPSIKKFESYRRTGSHHDIKRTESAALALQEQEIKRLFRSFGNYLKAMMAAIDDRIITADEALLPYMMLAGGRTVAEEIEANIERVLAGAPPLPMLEEGSA